MISLSDMTPKARIKINNGTGFLTLGTSTTICPFVNVASGATIRIATLRISFDASSDIERISAL